MVSSGTLLFGIVIDIAVLRSESKYGRRRQEDSAEALRYILAIMRQDELKVGCVLDLDLAESSLHMVYAENV